MKDLAEAGVDAGAPLGALVHTVLLHAELASQPLAAIVHALACGSRPPSHDVLRRRVAPPHFRALLGVQGRGFRDSPVHLTVPAPHTQENRTTRAAPRHPGLQDWESTSLGSWDAGRPPFALQQPTHTPLGFLCVLWWQGRGSGWATDGFLVRPQGKGAGRLGKGVELPQRHRPERRSHSAAHIECTQKPMGMFGSTLLLHGKSSSSPQSCPANVAEPAGACQNA